MLISGLCGKLLTWSSNLRFKSTEKLFSGRKSQNIFLQKTYFPKPSEKYCHSVGGRVFGLYEKILRHRCQNVILCVGKKLLNWKICFQVFSSGWFFGKWAKSLGNFVKLFQTGLSKLHFTCQKYQREHKLFAPETFLEIPSDWVKHFWIFGKDFHAWLSKPPCTWSTLRKKEFERKYSVEIFSDFGRSSVGLLAKEFRQFTHNFILKVESSFVFLGKNVFRITSFGQRAKQFWTFDKNVRRCLPKPLRTCQETSLSITVFEEDKKNKRLRTPKENFTEFSKKHAKLPFTCPENFFE